MFIHIPLFCIQLLTWTLCVRMSGRHTGEHLAWELKALLKSFGIENKVSIFVLTFSPHTYYVSHKILMIVCDNASNNDVMIRELELEGFRGTKGHVRCFVHILNLAVKVCGALPSMFLGPHKL